MQNDWAVVQLIIHQSTILDNEKNINEPKTPEKGKFGKSLPKSGISIAKDALAIFN